MIEMCCNCSTGKLSSFLDRHVDDCSNACALMHIVECIIDLVEIDGVSDEFVELQFFAHVLLYVLRQLRSSC